MKINYLKAVIILSFLATYSLVNADWNEVESNGDIYQGQSSNFKQESFEIMLDPQEAIEYKFSMKKNDKLVYQWLANIDKPELLPVEFHGHTEKDSNGVGTLIFYKKHADGKEHGGLTAPFDGIHGWYLENNSDEEITIKLDVAGWYENSFRIQVPR